MSKIEKLREIAKNAISEKYYKQVSDSDILCEKSKVFEPVNRETCDDIETRYCAIANPSWNCGAIVVEIQHFGAEIGRGFALFDEAYDDYVVFNKIDEECKSSENTLVTISEIDPLVFDAIMEAKKWAKQ